MNTNDIIEEILKQIKQPLWENWYIKEKIGSGAFSAVYKVEAKRSSRRTSIAALKIEPITSDGKHFIDEERKRHYIEQKKEYSETEAEIMYNLRKSPYIVAYEEEDIKELYINGVFEGYYYLIRMEYLNSVTEKMTNGTFDYSEGNIVKLALNIGNGIKTAHDIGVIHRDIKLDNFFVDDFGLYKLGDFNISKKTDATRTFAGTHGYLAPEIFMAKANVDVNYTSQADIYSFGICLYQFMNDLLFPFEDDNVDMETAIDRRMNGEKLPPPKYASEEFARIILKACEFSVDTRYKNMDEMLRDLTLLNGELIYSSRVEIKPKEEKQEYYNDERINDLPAPDYDSKKQTENQTDEGSYNEHEEYSDEEAYTEEALNVTVGCTIAFGHYFMQNGSYKEPIEWRVLDIQERRALITSVYGIDAGRYNESEGPAPWQSSSLRMWLNNEFINIAFKESEKNAILQAELINNDNTVYLTENGGNTVDRVFLLSIYEANTYFKNDEDRILYPTELAVSQGVYVAENGGCWWWLRSPGSHDNYAADVDYGGDIDSYGSDKVYGINAIRPAMWVSIDDLFDSWEPTPSEIITDDDDIPSAFALSSKGYNTVEFGSYYNNTMLSKVPIRWRVLEVRDKIALLITDKCIDSMPYNKGDDDITWAQSDIRKWLNKDFLNTAFTPQQRSGILPINNTNPANPLYETRGGIISQDHIFLLSIDEMYKYFEDDRDRTAKPTGFARSKGIYVNQSGKCWWWLRSSGCNQNYAADVDYGGDVDLYGSSVKSTNNGVRPAMWVKLDIL